MNFETERGLKEHYTEMILDYDQSDDDEFREQNFKCKKIQKIGKGSYGRVYKCQDLVSGDLCAVKKIKKTKNREFEIEKNSLATFESKNIVRYRRSYETRNHFYLVMDYAEGGTLRDLILEKRSKQVNFSEEEISQIMHSIFSAVYHLHDKNIIHRDIKPENILVVDKNDLGTLKLIDFGLCRVFRRDQQFQTQYKKYGTLIYMAPEQFNDDAYGIQVDIWSCAIIMYMLYTNGKHPFYKQTDDKYTYAQKLQNPQWTLPANMPLLARNLFQKITDKNPVFRYNTEKCLRHPWVSRNFEDKIPLTLEETKDVLNNAGKLMNNLKAMLFLQILKKKGVLKALPKKSASLKVSPKTEVEEKISTMSEKDIILEEEENQLRINFDTQPNMQSNSPVQSMPGSSRYVYKKVGKCVNGMTGTYTRSFFFPNSQLPEYLKQQQTDKKGTIEIITNKKNSYDHTQVMSSRSQFLRKNSQFKVYNKENYISPYRQDLLKSSQQDYRFMKYEIKNTYNQNSNQKQQGLAENQNYQNSQQCQKQGQNRSVQRARNINSSSNPAKDYKIFDQENQQNFKNMHRKHQTDEYGIKSMADMKRRQSSKNIMQIQNKSYVSQENQILSPTLLKTQKQIQNNCSLPPIKSVKNVRKQ